MLAIVMGRGAHSDVVHSIKLDSLGRGGITDPCSGSHAVGRESVDCGRPNVASGSDDKDRGCEEGILAIQFD